MGVALLVAGGLALTLVLSGHRAAPSLRAQLNSRPSVNVAGAARPAQRPLPRSVTGWSCRVAAGSPCGRPSCTVYVASASCPTGAEFPLNRILTLHRLPGAAARLRRLPGSAVLLSPRQITRLGGLFSQIPVLSKTP